jgi:hypothetical protein
MLETTTKSREQQLDGASFARPINQTTNFLLQKSKKRFCDSVLYKIGQDWRCSHSVESRRPLLRFERMGVIIERDRLASRAMRTLYQLSLDDL